MNKRANGSQVLAAAILLGGGLIAGSASAVELVTNGGFETGSFSGWTAFPLPDQGAFGVDNTLPHSGVDSAFFGGDGSTTYRISQVLSTVANTSYTVSFWLDGRFTAGGAASFVGSFGGSNFVSLSDADGAFTFKHYTFQLTATSASTTLSFAGYNKPDFYTLDDVSVQGASPVPEPASYALAALGLAVLLGWAKRRPPV